MRAVIAFLVIVLATARAQTLKKCSEEVSANERRSLIRAAILNKLGLERPPLLVPLEPTPNQMAHLTAVQQLQSMQEEERPMCTRPEAFSTLKRANFQSEATAVTPSSSYEYSVYDYLIGKREEQHQSSAIPPTVYHFTFPINITYDDRIYISSELSLLRRVSTRGRGFLTKTETIKLSYLYKVQYLRNGHMIPEIRQEIIETKVVDTVDGYMSFNTTSAVNKWMEMNSVDSGIITLQVLIQPPISMVSGLPLSPVIEFDIFNNLTAQLVLTFARSENIPDASRSTRKKRQGLPTVKRLDTKFCFATPTEPNCCVRKLSINFATDLGYTWIASPKDFKPNYCTGLCPALWPTSSNSTTLLRTYKERNPTFAVEPCCAPEDLGALSLLLDFGNGPQITTLPDMVIKSCICR